MGAKVGNALLLVALGILIGVIMSFCISSITAPSEEQVKVNEMGVAQEDIQDKIRVVHDNERSVTCWVWSIGTSRGGISCIPDHLLTP